MCLSVERNNFSTFGTLDFNRLVLFGHPRSVIETFAVRTLDIAFTVRAFSAERVLSVFFIYQCTCPVAIEISAVYFTLRKALFFLCATWNHGRFEKKPVTARAAVFSLIFAFSSAPFISINHQIAPPIFLRHDN